MAKTANARARRAKDNAAANRVEEYFAAIDEGGQKYRKADEIIAELLETVGVGETITLSDGQEFVLEDQFATKNKVWKPCGVSRYVLSKKR
jgi:hypothetical protein